MAHSLLILALLASQLLASGAGPLYLCLRSDGAVCLDRGPETCHCCRKVVPTSASRCCCGCPAVSEPPADVFGSPQTESCQHFQIADGNASVNVRLTRAADHVDAHASQAFSIAFALPLQSPQTRLVATRCRQFVESPDSLSSAPTVMRC